jgi:hypothetical protein
MIWGLFANSGVRSEAPSCRERSNSIGRNRPTNSTRLRIEIRYLCATDKGFYQDHDRHAPVQTSNHAV